MRIDPYLFEQHYRAFVASVERKSTVPFESFVSNPYTEEQEGYKRAVYEKGRQELGYLHWTEAAVGTGKILDAVIRAIEVKGNNLVQWEPRFGEASRPHQPLYEAREDSGACHALETCLFRLYRNSERGRLFDEIVERVGKKYALLAYLYFLKDCSRFMPIAPTIFERSFSYLGVEFRASGQCSWSNYEDYIAVLRDIRELLSEELGSEATLLDAHSFAYMLAREMEGESALPDVVEYWSLSDTEREAIVRARVGQGRFREALISFWGSCAVTGLREERLLVASHIVPWRDASLPDRHGLENGLLLAPHLDAAFDSGFISFDDEGWIMISQHMSRADAEALGIHEGMKLREMAAGHRRTLQYHRREIFKL